MTSWRIYFKLMGVSFRSQMQHRASFWMLTLAHFLSTFVDIAGIWVLFDRFKMVEGWTLKELALIYGVMHMGFAAAEALARGFDTFSQMVKHGDFDRVLLRPMGTLFQMAAREIQFMRIGRFMQGFLVLLWGCFELQISFLSMNTFIIAMAFVGTASLFYGLFVIQATLSFWTTETLELMNIATYGGLESGQYPMSLYKPLFQAFFTFIIPLACVAYFPIAAMLQLADIPFWGVIAPVAGVAFLAFAFVLWNVGVQHYQSTGS